MTATSRGVPLSPRVARSLKNLGQDIEIARKKRRLTIVALCERSGISLHSYQRLAQGSPVTAIGAYAMVLHALGLGTPFDSLADTGKDDTGLLLEEERLPRRVRGPRNKTGAL